MRWTLQRMSLVLWGPRTSAGVRDVALVHWNKVESKLTGRFESNQCFR